MILLCRRIFCRPFSVCFLYYNTIIPLLSSLLVNFFIFYAQIIVTLCNVFVKLIRSKDVISYIVRTFESLPVSLQTANTISCLKATLFLYAPLIPLMAAGTYIPSSYCSDRARLSWGKIRPAGRLFCKKSTFYLPTEASTGSLTRHIHRIVEKVKRGKVVSYMNLQELLSLRPRPFGFEPLLYFYNEKTTLTSGFFSWYTIRGSNPGHPD